MAERGSWTLITRHRYLINGIVQGVGFRPLVFRLAHEQNLAGWVRNTPAGIELEIEGSKDGLDTFQTLLLTTLPPLALITSHSWLEIPATGSASFLIRPSSGGEPDIQIAPDSAICPDCLQELLDPTNRRYRYPFITCTNCGPRYSIITDIPYDRPKTTMTGFALCPDCLQEYQNPLDRRFHAQPIACHTCGPQVSLITASGETIAERDEAITGALELLKNGAILAIKGICGYHLAVDACNQDAVKRLRERKKRDEKPFAIMAADIKAAHELVLMNEVEEQLLSSFEAPIVIVRKKTDSTLSPFIAPNNGWLGLMLPYAPLHHLLMRHHFQALVMTSGNVSDEPVAYKDNEALQQLAGIADYFLSHDRPIHIRNDDSVIRVFQGKPLFHRRSRGYAPRAVTLPFTLPPLLAVGAELKNSICLASDNRAILSQHIGDLKNRSTLDSFEHTINHLSNIMAIKPEAVACDLHPDYLSTRYAEEAGLPLIRVQHHHAHLASCMAENSLDGDVIGVIFDGTGLGDDGTIWGGEFLTGGYRNYQRVGYFKPTPLPGGDAAVREPWRMAMSYLYQTMGETALGLDHPVARMLPENERQLFAQMLRRGINSPLTSSCGRLFDAVAALLNVRHVVSYDGQGAIELEALAELAENLIISRYHYTFSNDNGKIQLDFTPMLVQILADSGAGIATSTIAHRFHQTIAVATTETCLHITETTGLDRVILSGGVFQNRLLSEMIYTALTEKGLKVFTHRLIPPNDGGIALGQAAIAGRRMV